MAKRQGWDADAYNKARRNGELKQEQENVKAFRRAQRPPYDPAKEQVMDLVGKFDLDRDGRNTVFVEYVSYEGTGPLRLQVTKRGNDRDGKPFSTPNVGRLYPEQAKRLAELLLAGAGVASARNVDLDRGARNEPKAPPPRTRE
jgi:hypothetical protein